jgi:hypothetical protein
MNGQGEFYIGLAERAPDGVRARLRRTVVLLLTLSIALRVVLALAQRTIGVSVFEWGQVKSFSGLLQSQPYPHLLVPRPGVGA